MTERNAVDPMVPVMYRVARTARELPDTHTLELAPVRDAAVGGFGPGQFNMLYAFGVGEVPISVSGDPAHGGRLVHTIRSVGPVTRALCGLRTGQQLGVRGPFGAPWPVSDCRGKDIVVVAGGIGLAPLRPVVYAVLADRTRFGNVCVFYGARTPEEILFRRELEHWRGRFDTTVDVTVDRARENWMGRVGVVTQLLTRGGYDPHNTVAMVCGPEIMMRFAVQTLNEQGVDDDRIYVSMERNMKCALGFCGHCQMGASFVCKDGPVFRFDRIRDRFVTREL